MSEGPSSLFTAEYYSVARSCHNLLIHSPMEGHLGCLQAEASMGQVARILLAMSLYTQAHMQVFPFISSEEPFRLKPQAFGGGGGPHV